MGVDLQMPAAFKALQKNSIADVGDFPEDTLKQQLDSASVSDTSQASHHEFDFGESEHQSSGTFSVVSSSSARTAPNPIWNGSAPSDRAGHDKGNISRSTSKLTTRTISHSPVPTSETAKPNYGNALPPNEAARLRFAAAHPGAMNAGGATPRPGLADQIAQMKLSASDSANTFSAGIDRYGFRKPTNYMTQTAFDEWTREYTKYMEYRKGKWRNLLKSNGLRTSEQDGGPPTRFPPESMKLRRYVRKGIPPSWRGNAWFWYARGYDKLNSHPGLYDKLVKDCEGLKNSDTEHIERDLHRTFPDNIYFQNVSVTGEESAQLCALRRVLTAFSVYQPKIGYCQSLNFIAGTLLLVLPEERAFWMLVIITQNYLIGLHDINLEQVNISQGVLMISVRDRLPKIWKALTLDQTLEDNFITNLPPISLCTAPWFMSLMVNVLPTETMMRIWDCFFVEGPKTLFRISLAILKIIEPELQAANDEMEVFQLIQSAPRKLHDPEVLIKTCFRRNNGFGHISNEDIKMLRTFVQNRRKASQEGLGQDTSDRHAYAKLHRGRRVRSKLRIYR